jgi:hypothetical protein
MVGGVGGDGGTELPIFSGSCKILADKKVSYSPLKFNVKKISDKSSGGQNSLAIPPHHTPEKRQENLKKIN